LAAEADEWVCIPHIFVERAGGLEDDVVDDDDDDQDENGPDHEEEDKGEE